MSDLRDRIAAVVAERYRTDPINTVEGWSVLLADAVIAELGLRREWHDSQIVTNEQGATYFIQGGHRYVTDWKADDE